MISSSSFFPIWIFNDLLFLIILFSQKSKPYMCFFLNLIFWFGNDSYCYQLNVLLIWKKKLYINFLIIIFKFLEPMQWINVMMDWDFFFSALKSFQNVSAFVIDGVLFLLRAVSLRYGCRFVVTACAWKCTRIC